MATIAIDVDDPAESARLVRLAARSASSNGNAESLDALAAAIETAAEEAAAGGAP